MKDLSKDPVDLIFFKKTRDGKQKTVDPDDPDAVSKALSENNLFLTADRTTLGGDDGIGVAIALALLSDKELSAPPIEFVCTVSEETGMIGASKIDLSELQGKKLINLDSDDEGYFMLGCAGGGGDKEGDDVGVEGYAAGTLTEKQQGQGIGAKTAYQGGA